MEEGEGGGGKLCLVTLYTLYGMHVHVAACVACVYAPFPSPFITFTLPFLQHASLPCHCNLCLTYHYPYLPPCMPMPPYPLTHFSISPFCVVFILPHLPSFYHTLHSPRPLPTMPPCIYHIVVYSVYPVYSPCVTSPSCVTLHYYFV